MGKLIGILVVIVALIIVGVFLFNGIFSGGFGLGLNNTRGTKNGDPSQSLSTSQETESQNAGNQTGNDNEIVLKIDIQGTDVIFENTTIQSLDALAERIKVLFKEAGENEKLRVVILTEDAIYRTVNEVKEVLSDNNIAYTVE